MRWCTAEALTLSPQTCSLIWDQAQDGTRSALRNAFPRLLPGTLTLVLSQHHVVIDRALVDHGEAIWNEMKTMRDCVETGRPYKLSGAAIRWITAKVEQTHLHPVVLTAKQERDAYYMYELKALRATIEDTGWGKRHYAVFNADELNISKTGVHSDSIMLIYWWAQELTSMNTKLRALWQWLNEIIQKTRRHRAKQRRNRAIKANKLAA